MHSAINKGYLCGEMHSLSCVPRGVWTRYSWVIYSNPDVIITPEFFLRLHARLPRLVANTFLLADRFPGGYHHRPRYSMEVFVFRTSLMWLPREATPEGAISTERNDTVWHAASRRCLHPPRGSGRVIPEDLLYVILRELKLPVEVPLGALMNEMRDKNGRTQLFPGGIWHAHNHQLAREYLQASERGENVHMNATLFSHFHKLMSLASASSSVLQREVNSASIFCAAHFCSCKGGQLYGGKGWSAGIDSRPFL
jgi:hypothetical protein